MAASLSGATLLNVGILLGASFIVGELFERIGLESILGYIFTGLLMGAGLKNFAKLTGLIPPEWAISASSVTAFATVGATLILFQAGLREQNVKEIFMHKRGLQLGTLVLSGSFLFIFSALMLTGSSLLPYQGVMPLVFLALAYSIVDIGVPSKIMLSRGLIREEMGSYTIKSAVINVTTGFMVMTGLVILLTPTLQSQAIKTASILGFGLVFYFLHEFIHRIDDYIVMFEEAEAQFAITFALLLSMSYMTQTIGISSVLGAFFAGVLVSRSEFTDSRAFQEKINGISEGLFVPIFFAWFGLSLQIFGSHGILANIEAATYLFLLSTVAKLGIGYAVTKIHNMEKPAMIASSLISLDIETLVVLLIAIDLGVLTNQILQIFAPSVLFSTLTIIGLYTILDR
ncbi:MAG: cation:proton antiporter [Candidatus Nanohalobium sp.]